MNECYNTRCKVYEDVVEVTFCNRQVFNPEGIEPNRDRTRPSFPRRANGSAVRADSHRRAKSKIRDIAYANREVFAYFVTLTINSDILDRYDASLLEKHLQTWLKNLVARRGLKYLLIAEYHKDGAIHFHGFFNEVIDVIDSGRKSKGRVVYNIPSWKFGFSTAIRLYGPRAKAINYLLKYIGKDSKMIFKNFYLCGGKLKRHVPSYYINENYCSVDAVEYEPIGCKLRFKYVKLSFKDWVTDVVNRGLTPFYCPS